MRKAELRKQLLLERMADHVLAHGLQAASLRPLAAAAGTSDRMLLHYFADKEELLTATLTLVAQRLLAVLERARADPLPFHILLPQLAAMLQDPQIQPYMRLWLELITFAAGGKEPFRSVAQQILNSFSHWIAAGLRVENEEQRAPLAALMLALIEGFVLFDTLGADATRALALAGVALIPRR